MWVAIAEKSSQAEKIAIALGLQRSSGVYKGYFLGQELVLWYAAGHFLELSPPDKTIENYSWNDPKSHECIPRSVPYVICPDLPARDGYPARQPRKRIELLQSYLKNASLVIGATDPDREGEVIYRTILNYLNYTGPLKRVWLSKGLSPEAILSCFNDLQDGDKFYGEYCAGVGRRMADYSSMILTATYTYYARRGMLGRNLGLGDGRAGTVSVGRVQSAVVAFLHDRNLERANFVPITHYRPVPLIQCNGQIDFEGKYSPVIADEQYSMNLDGIHWDEKNLSSAIQAGMSEEEIEDIFKNNRPKPLYVCKAKVDDFCLRLKTASIVDLNISESISTCAPPKPLSLTKLQSLITNASAKEVLDAAQRLYDAGFISYPRSEESEYSTKDYNPHDIANICNQLARWERYGQAALNVAQLHGPSSNNTAPNCYTSASKAHEALAPVLIPSEGQLSGLDLQVFDLITTHYLQAHLPPSQYHVQSGTISFGTKGLFGEPTSNFKISKRTCCESGWEEFFQKSEVYTPVSLTDLDRSNINVPDVVLKESTTSKPSLYNEASLLFAMYHAAKFEKDPVLRDSLKESKGIGTPATRPDQIATILVREYAQYTSKRKNPSLDITNKGIELYRSLPESFRSPGTTAKWELELNKIAGMSPDQADTATADFIDNQVQQTENLIKFLNNNLYDKTPKNSVNPNLPLSLKTKEKLEKRCKGMGKPVPRQALVSEAAARQWLQQNPWLISDSMRRKIYQIETFKGIKAPPLQITDFGKAIEWIKQNEEGVPCTPSKAFVDYAVKLANSTGQKIPKEAFKDAKVLGKYVDSFKQIKKPSSALTKSITQLAKELRVRISTSNLETEAVARETLSRLKQLKKVKLAQQKR